jgi:hypothetical protein
LFRSFLTSTPGVLHHWGCHLECQLLLTWTGMGSLFEMTFPYMASKRLAVSGRQLTSCLLSVCNQWQLCTTPWGCNTLFLVLWSLGAPQFSLQPPMRILLGLSRAWWWFVFQWDRWPIVLLASPNTVLPPFCWCVYC